LAERINLRDAGSLTIDFDLSSEIEVEFDDQLARPKALLGAKANPKDQ
jgi:hypothetical protein